MVVKSFSFLSQGLIRHFRPELEKRMIEFEAKNQHMQVKV
jgi:hypothetical protein